jgi:hypothetical protein
MSATMPARNIDLFTPVVSENAQHPNFRNIHKQPNGFNCDVLNDWARGFQDRDGKFVKEFQTTFDSSFWELYLFAVLKHLHLEGDFSVSSPDFYVTNIGGVNIEATVASHGLGATPEFMKDGAEAPKDLNEFNRQTILRIRNSLDTKRKKYQDRYSSLSHVRNRPFVVAVTTFDRPFAQLTSQRAIEAVLHGYYVDEERFLRDGGALKGYQIAAVTKDNQSDVPVGVFSSQEFAWLSAVVFSSCATWGKVRALSSDPNPNIVFQAVRLNANGVAPHVVRAPKSRYSESLLDGLSVYHNPLATHKLSLEMFRHEEVFQSFYSEEEQDWVYEHRNGLLVWRSVLTGIAAPTSAEKNHGK